MLDACLRVFSAILTRTGETDGKNGLYVPFAVGRLVLYRLPGDSLWCCVKLQGQSAASTSQALGDVFIFDANGRTEASLHDVGLKKTTPERLLRSEARASPEGLHQLRWAPQADESPISAPADDASPPWFIFQTETVWGLF